MGSQIILIELFWRQNRLRCGILDTDFNVYHMQALVYVFLSWKVLA